MIKVTLTKPVIRILRIQENVGGGERKEYFKQDRISAVTFFTTEHFTANCVSCGRTAFMKLFPISLYSSDFQSFFRYFSACVSIPISMRHIFKRQ